MTAAARLRRPLAAALVALALATLCPQASAGEIALPDRRSGYAFMSRETQRMQDDLAANPGMLTVLEGETLWRARPPVGKSCADCHGAAETSMKGVAARYPRFDAAEGRPVDLEHKIAQCRAHARAGHAPRRESGELLALTAYVAHQSRGLPIAPPDDPRLAPFRDQGRDMFRARQGQLNLSCSQCHDDNWGKSLAGAPIPQAHPTGYPIYRLEWQATGSLERRLRNCLVGMRAEPFEPGAPEYAILETYLMWRARGLPIETPAVRP
jgi:sulfur-oxidizing protein SoxA